MSAIPAFRGYPDYLGQPSERPRISVVPGEGHKSAPTLSSGTVFLAKCVAVVLVLLALLGFVRVGLASATVTTTLETEELSSQVDAARTEGSKLELQQSSLANSARIRDSAAAMGMIAPEQIDYINLTDDIVAVDASGALSLSGSVARAAGV